MKKLLKFLLVPVFVGSTALTVVACGSSATFWNEDILELAVGQMQNHTFLMNAELGLDTLPTGKFNDRANLSVRNDINGYYQSLVKTNDVTWDNPTVDVTIRADATESEFVDNYKGLVETRVTLIAYLSYKTLSTTTPIVVKINNDETLPQARINAIGGYLGEYLDTQPTFNFKELFTDDLSSTDPNVNFAKIEAPLRQALFKDKTKENPFPVIDVEGVDIEVRSAATTSQVIYKLNDSAIDGSLIKGTLQNLNLVVQDGSFRSEAITGKTLNVAQAVSEAGTQISNILTPPSSWTLEVATLPTAGASLADSTEVQNLIRTDLFSKIALIYPTKKMTTEWKDSLITFPNGESNLYVVDDKDSNRGYFLIDMKFDFLVGPDPANPNKEIRIEVLLSSIKVNLVSK